MEMNEELKALMEKIESENAGQELYAKKQYTMSKISAAASILILLIVILCAGILMPRILKTFDQMDAIISEATVIIEEVNTMTTEVSTVLPIMIENTNDLVTSASSGMEEALEKMNSIDVETLNQSIQSLHNIVAPMAKFFGR